MPSKKPNVKINSIGEMPPLEILAEQIAKVAKFGTDIKESSLTENAILILLKAKTGMHQTEVKKVLDELVALQDFIKPKKDKR